MEKEDRINHGRADQPQRVNPKDVDYEEPAKLDKSQEKIEINQSGLGRDASQTPADEQMITDSQIDEGTKELMEEKNIEQEKKAEKE